MLRARVYRAIVPSQILEFILSISCRDTYVRQRRFASEVRQSADSSILSKFSALIRSDQELKQTEADAEAHNRRVSTLRGALRARALSEIRDAYYDLVKHQSDGAVVGRDFQEISWMLNNHFQSCSLAKDAMDGTVEMALQAAVRGHTAALKSFLLLQLKAGDASGALSVYARFHRLSQDILVEESRHSTTLRPEGISDIIKDDFSHYEMADLGLIMITAHAMQDRFDDALDCFLATPMTTHISTDTVKVFCGAYFPEDVHLSKKVQMWAKELVFLRLMSRQLSLRKYISNLSGNKQISHLEKLYTSVISHLKQVGGRLVVEPSSQSRENQGAGRRVVVVFPSDSWGSFLEAFFRCSRQDLVETLWNDVIKLGLTPNRRMWAVLLDSYGHQRDIDRAKAVWNRMLDAGIEPDETTYGAMISAYFLTLRPTEGYALFQQFLKTRRGSVKQKESLSSPCMLRLFNIVLQGLCTNAKDDLARSLLKEMAEHGPKPDIVSYNTFLRHYGRIGDMKGLGGVLRSLQPAGVQPDVHSFTTVLSALYKAGKPDAHTKVLEIMQAIDVQPNVATYSAIIHFFVRQGGEENLRKAGELLGLMETELDKASRPNEVTYTGMLAGVHRDTTISPENVRVFTAEILHRMRGQGKPPNRVTYHILIKACLDNPLPIGLEAALQYYYEMRKRKITLSNDTWYVMLAGLLRRRDWVIAREVMADMFLSGQEPNSALTTLILRIQKAMELANQRALQRRAYNQ